MSAILLPEHLHRDHEGWLLLVADQQTLGSTRISEDPLVHSFQAVPLRAVCLGQQHVLQSQLNASEDGQRLSYQACKCSATNKEYVRRIYLQEFLLRVLSTP